MSEPEKVMLETKIENVHGFKIAIINCESVLAGTKLLDAEVTIPPFKIKGENRDQFLVEITQCIEKYTLY